VPRLTVTTRQWKRLERVTGALIPRPLWDAVREPILGWAMARVPDRRFLETVAFAWLRSSGMRPVLFVGVSRVPDTRRYQELLGPEDYWSLDVDPSAAGWGGRRHVTADLRTWTGGAGGPRFRAVVLNGVVGWGLNSLDDCDAALRTCAGVLVPGGVLVLGWNTPRPPDPRDAPQLRVLFEPCDGPAGHFMEFPGSDHVIGFWRRR
jgi:hypothetical protein